MKRFAACIALLPLCAGQAAAENAAVQLTATPLTVSSTGSMFGWEFNTSSGLLINQLGIYDESGDGLVAAHEVAIWKANTEEVLVSATVPAGTSAELVDGFRYVDIDPILLEGGRDFVVASLFSSTDDIIMDDDPAVTFDPAIIFKLQRKQESVGALEFPDDSTSSPVAYFGPNMRFSFAPEPSSVWLAVWGALALLGFRRRRNSCC